MSSGKVVDRWCSASPAIGSATVAAADSLTENATEAMVKIGTELIGEIQGVGLGRGIHAPLAP